MRWFACTGVVVGVVIAGCGRLLGIDSDEPPIPPAIVDASTNGDVMTAEGSVTIGTILDDGGLAHGEWLSVERFVTAYSRRTRPDPLSCPNGRVWVAGPINDSPACTGCSCTSGSCSMTLQCWENDVECGELSPSTQRAVTSTCATFGGQLAACRAVPMVASECAPPTAKPDPGHLWTEWVLACPTSQPSLGQACIMHPGEVACPPSYPDQSLVYSEEVKDARDCNCTCKPTLIECSRPIVQIFSSKCPEKVLVGNVNDKCVPISPGAEWSAQVISSLIRPCEAVVTKTGSVQRSAPATVCCNPTTHSTH